MQLTDPAGSINGDHQMGLHPFLSKTLAPERVNLEESMDTSV
jgi:hypothetical protein